VTIEVRETARFCAQHEDIVIGRTGLPVTPDVDGRFDLRDRNC
jgi:hypothetical protein